MVVPILQNAALLAFAAIAAYAVFSNVTPDCNKLRCQVAIGLVMGLTIFLISATPNNLESHQIPLDARAGVLVYSGYLGGPIGALIATACGAMAGNGINGSELWSGMVSFGLFALFGAAIAKVTPTPAWPKTPLAGKLWLITGAAVLSLAPTQLVSWADATQGNLPFAATALPLMAAGAASTLFMGSVIHLAFAISRLAPNDTEPSQRLRLVAKAKNLGTFERNVKEDSVTFDTRVCQILGLPENQRKMTLERWVSFVLKEDVQTKIRALERALHGGSPNEPTVFRIVRNDGKVRHIRAYWTTKPKDGRPSEKIVGIYEDITDAVEAERTKVVAETRLDTAVRIAGIGFYTFSTDTGECSFCSDQHARQLGLTPEEFKEWANRREPSLDHVHEDDRQTILDAIKRINQGQSQTFEYRAFHKNGDLRYIRQIEEPTRDETGRIVAHTGTSLDLTDLRKAEMRLRQSQRIEAIGTLTGGIAHDFNNLLAIILGNLELWLETGKDEEGGKLVSTAYDAAIRGADLTKSLLSFSRRAPLHPIHLNLNRLCESTLDWTTGVLPANISVDVTLFGDLWGIEVDAVSAENAIINLVLNARDAMPEGGTVRVETANEEIYAGQASYADLDVPPGRYVVLTIADTGHGIEPDKIKHVFEPFFTDKPRGKGSGLGLSMVQGFMEQSGGTIRLSSTPGKGTTFRLYFKAAKAKAPHPVAPPIASHAATGTGTTILVAEDEPDVRAVITKFLESAGYSALSAANGEDALEAFHSAAIVDLLLSDAVMPGTLQGQSLIKALRSVQPDLPCIILSGYAAGQASPRVTTRAPETPASQIKMPDIHLAKPISRADLLRAVSGALKLRHQTAGAHS